MNGYFDANATAPLLASAREAWLAAQDAFWANPSGPTAASARARNFLAQQREIVAQLFNVDPAQVVFTSGASEANNAVCRGMARKRSGSRGAANWVRSPFEHPSVVEAFAADLTVETLVFEGTAEGLVDLAAAERLLSTQPVGLVSILTASNETGVIQPFAEIAELARASGARVHLDAVQWVGRKPLEELRNYDFLVISGHKFGGPKGVGCLILGTEMSDFRLSAGGGQERGRRAGTEDLAGIAAMVAALQEAAASPSAAFAGRDRLIDDLERLGARVLGRDIERLPQTIAAVMPRFDRTRWISRLDRRGFAIGAGAACSTGKEGSSATLRAMGLSEEEAARTVRISGLRDASPGDWKALGQAFASVLAELDEDADGDRFATVIEIP
jgi:cysteine desulfurase